MTGRAKLRDPIQPPLVLNRISKRFGTLLALDSVSLTLGPGEIIGFVGPNGAGKTTAIHILLGLLRATGGQGSLLGRPLGDATARAQVGYVPDAPVFFPGNAIETVGFAARLSGARPTRAQMEEVLRRVSVHEWRRDVRTFSRGMQQRLALALALIHQPRVLILDEPAAALDPVGVVEVRALLRELRAQGVSILFSSHQLAEVEEISDRIAFLQDGRLLRYGTLAELLGDEGWMRVVMRGAQLRLPPAFGEYQVAATEADTIVWELPRDLHRACIEAGWSAGAELVRAEPRTRTLGELYLKWSRQAAGEDEPAGELEAGR